MHTEIAVMRFGKLVWDESAIVSDDWADTYNNPIGNNNSGNNTQGYQTVSNGDFGIMKKTISEAFSDNNMLSTAKAVIRNNYLSVAQVTEITKLFFSDLPKLNFLKYAYD